MAGRNGTAQPSKPPVGERTGPQTIAARVGIFSWFDSSTGPVPSGSYSTYRLMRQNPTVALARAAAFAPMQATPWTYEADDDVPEERVKFIQGVMEPLRERFFADCLRSLDYGFQAFEKVWKVDEGQFVYEKLKPLFPDWTWPLFDLATGALIGLTSNPSMLNVPDLNAATSGTTLGADKMFWLTHDGEAGDPFGRSRHENIRRNAWKPWTEMADRIGQYAAKSAGVIPMVHYPEGVGKDATGADADNYELARQVLSGLTRTKGVALPNKMQPWAEDVITRAGSTANLKDLMAWRVEFLEAATGHGSEMLEVLKHYESLILRGWLVPERSAIEGQFGTKAEAGTHGDLGTEIAGGTLCEMLTQINESVVDPLLVVNFGPEAKGTVRIKAGALTDEDQAYFRDLLKGLVGANADIAAAWFDIDAILDAANIPKSAEVVDPAKLRQQEAEVAGPTPADGPAVAARQAGDVMGAPYDQ